MKAKIDNMLAIPLQKLKATEPMPFPLYLWLKLNDRLVPIRTAGEALGEEKYKEFLSKNLVELWIPSDFQKHFIAYLDKVEGKVDTLAEVIDLQSAKQNAGVAATANTAAGASAEAGNAEAPALAAAEAQKSEEAGLVTDILADPGMTGEEKAEVLSAIGQDILRSLNQIVERGEEPRRQGLKRCRQLADEILELAHQHKSFYDEIIAIRNSQEDLEHSMMVGTVAVMFALATGVSDKDLLADITLAGLFHDIGLTKVNPRILIRPENTWTGPERQEYQNHILESVKLLQESSKEFNPAVMRMIREHHENHDGSGYPEGRQGGAIAETSQFLHLANLFDKFCTGKLDAKELSPQEAFKAIADIANDSRAVQEVNPDTVRNVFNCILSDAGNLGKIQDEMQARGDRAKAEVLGI